MKRGNPLVNVAVGLIACAVVFVVALYRTDSATNHKSVAEQGPVTTSVPLTTSGLPTVNSSSPPSSLQDLSNDVPAKSAQLVGSEIEQAPEVEVTSEPPVILVSHRVAERSEPPVSNPYTELDSDEVLRTVYGEAPAGVRPFSGEHIRLARAARAQMYLREARDLSPSPEAVEEATFLAHAVADFLDGYTDVDPRLSDPTNPYTALINDPEIEREQLTYPPLPGEPVTEEHWAEEREIRAEKYLAQVTPLNGM